MKPNLPKGGFGFFLANKTSKMIKDFWDSFKDNIKERVTNPFLGTFILVWIIHNWKIVYAFFFFDKEYKLEQRIKFFNDYWTDKSFIWNIISVASITVGVLGITYIFLAFSRYVANLYENIVLPIIVKLSKGKIVTLEVYQTAVEKINSLEKKVDEERKSKNEAINERELLEKRITNSEKPEIVSADDDSLNKIITQVKSLFSNNEFENVIVKVSKNKGFDKNDDNGVINFLLKTGLIEVGSASASLLYYKFTSLGNAFKNRFFISE